VGLSPRAVLAFQRLDPRLFLGRQARPPPSVTLGSTNPVAQHLRRAADFARD